MAVASGHAEWSAWSAAAPAGGQWYPPEWPDRIRALADGSLVPVDPRRAATVMLLRDTPDGPAVHMLRRRASMAFAGGAYAYPGGGVDPRDEEHQVGWAGPSQEEWAARLGTDPRTAQAIVCGAVRETFEEAGVLLAGQTPDEIVGDTTGDDWEADRLALVARELSFAEFLDRRGLRLRSDLLGAWARWITPSSSRAATTPGSSSPPSPRGSAPATPPPRPTGPCGSARPTRPPGTTRASC